MRIGINVSWEERQLGGASAGRSDASATVAKRVMGQPDDVIFQDIWWLLRCACPEFYLRTQLTCTIGRGSLHGSINCQKLYQRPELALTELDFQAKKEAVAGKKFKGVEQRIFITAQISTEAPKI